MTKWLLSTLIGIGSTAVVVPSVVVPAVILTKPTPTKSLAQLLRESIIKNKYQAFQSDLIDFSTVSKYDINDTYIFDDVSKIEVKPFDKNWNTYWIEFNYRTYDVQYQTHYYSGGDVLNYSFVYKGAEYIGDFYWARPYMKHKLNQNGEIVYTEYYHDDERLLPALFYRIGAK